MATTKTEDKSFKGQYNRIFPSKVSTTSFLTLYVLFLFESKENFYGKELINEIEKRFEGNWKPSHGVVYPMLRKLEDLGLLEGYWDGDDESKKTKRVYKITEKGKVALKEETEKYFPVFVESFNMLVQILKDLYNFEDLQSTKID